MIPDNRCGRDMQMRRMDPERGGGPRGGGPRGGRAIRILVADDHAVVRQGIALLLKREPDMEVVGEAADGEVAVAQARELAPDVVLMDFSMPNLDGIEATRQIHQAHPRICVIGLSMYQEAEGAEAMLQAGASAYLSKTGRSEILLETIRRLVAED